MSLFRRRDRGFDWEDTRPFTGASAPGQPPGHDTAPDSFPMLRARPARYATEATGPQPALTLPPAIGDALTRDETWGPKLAPLPCGHCGAHPDIPAGILARARILGHVNWLAFQAGWAYDTDLILTCPPCQQGEAWKARQGQLELHRHDEFCPRHDAGFAAGARPDGATPCTCPGAVITVDVMLASEDYLGTGRGRHRAGTR